MSSSCELMNKKEVEDLMNDIYTSASAESAKQELVAVKEVVDKSQKSGDKEVHVACSSEAITDPSANMLPPPVCDIVENVKIQEPQTVDGNSVLASNSEGSNQSSSMPPPPVNEMEKITEVKEVVVEPQKNGDGNEEGATESISQAPPLLNDAEEAKIHAVENDQSDLKIGEVGEKVVPPDSDKVADIKAEANKADSNQNEATEEEEACEDSSVDKLAEKFHTNFRIPYEEEQSEYFATNYPDYTDEKVLALLNSNADEMSEDQKKLLEEFQARLLRRKNRKEYIATKVLSEVRKIHEKKVNYLQVAQRQFDERMQKIDSQFWELSNALMDQLAEHDDDDDDDTSGEDNNDD